MTYTPKTWVDGPTGGTPITAAELNRIESGVVDAVAKADTATQPADLAAAVTAAVNGLLNGAPGALNTLKELADAINDDASFAATITTALAARMSATNYDPAGINQQLLGLTAVQAPTHKDLSDPSNTFPNFSVPLAAQTANITASSPPTIGQINVYDASGGALTPPLNALSTYTVGATMLVQKYSGDATTNTVTITCHSGDTFDNATTTRTLRLADEFEVLQVISVSGTKHWKVVAEGKTLGSLDARYLLLSTVTAKGDVIVGASSGAVARLGVGADGTVLTADSTQTDGVKWGAGGGGGSGDASTNTSTSVDSEIAVFSGTAGKTIKRATGSGIAKVTSGVLGTATAGTDYLAPAGSAAALTSFPTLNQSTTGNAATATKLATARAINGVNFDGTAAITVADPAVVYLDSFTGTDDARLAAAMTFAAAQTHIPAIQFPAREVTLNVGGLTPYSGMKLIGPGGSVGAKDLEISNTYANHRVNVNAGVETSALFVATADVNNVHIYDLAFQDGAGVSQFWYQASGTTLRTSQWHGLTFYGFQHVLGSPTQSAAIDGVVLSGTWQVQAGFDTQFNLAGSDNSLWLDAFCNIGTSRSVGAGVYLLMLTSMQKSKVGYIYATVNTGWKALKLSGSGGSNQGVNFHGGTYEGTNGTPATVELIDVISGAYSFFGSAFNFVTDSGVNGAIVQSGGSLHLYSPTYIRESSAAATFPLLYQTAGVAHVVNPISGTSGENVYVRWSDGVTTQLFNDNDIHSGTPGMLAPAQVITTGAETFTIVSGSVTAIAGTTVNGYTPGVGDRIVVPNAPLTTGAGSSFSTNSNKTNGVYVVVSNTTNLTVTRASDMTGDVNPAGLSIYVQNPAAGSGFDGGMILTVTTPSTAAAFVWGTGSLAFSITGGASPAWGSIELFSGLNLLGGGGAAFTFLQANPAATSAATATLPILSDTLRGLKTRIGTTASSATPTINVDITDQYNITALAAPITGITVTGTPGDGQELVLRFKDNGTARAITHGASFLASGSQTLLATTVISKTHEERFRYDAVAAKFVLYYVDATGY